MSEEQHNPQVPVAIDRASDHQAKPQDDAWYVMDDVPGQGPRPEYLDTRYKSLGEQAKAYKELQKTLGAIGGAPEEYDFGSHKEAIDPGNQHVQEFVNYAKNNRITQDAFNKMLDTFVNYQKSTAPNMDEEIAKLGPDGGKRIEVVKQWAENNLSDKSLDAIGKIAHRAEVIELLDELRQFQFHQSTQPPTGHDAGVDFKPMSRADVEAEMMSNYGEYQKNPTYRAKITSMFEQAVG